MNTHCHHNVGPDVNAYGEFIGMGGMIVKSNF
jgi:hypothetical protein